MTTENLIEAKKESEKAYAAINDMISENIIAMIDLAYPKHDGEQDAEVISEMMLLRQSVNSLSAACNLLVNKLTDVIGDEEDENQ